MTHFLKINNGCEHPLCWAQSFWLLMAHTAVQEWQGDDGGLVTQPVVQTNGSSRSSTGRLLLSVSMLSSVWFSIIWQRFNWWDSSCTLPSFSAYFAYFFCRSVMTVISLEISKSICTVVTYISPRVPSYLN